MFDKPNLSLLATANELGIQVIQLQELEDIGQNVINPRPEQVIQVNFGLHKNICN